MIEDERFTKGDPVGWLDWSEINEHGFRNETERGFLTAFFARAAELSEVGLVEEDCMINYSDSRLMIGLDLLDASRTRVKRCLKIEFTGESLLTCDLDGSALIFFSELDAADFDVTEHRNAGASPAEFAGKAVEWVLKKFSDKSGFGSAENYETNAENISSG